MQDLVAHLNRRKHLVQTPLGIQCVHNTCRIPLISMLHCLALPSVPLEALACTLLSLGLKRYACRHLCSLLHVDTHCDMHAGTVHAGRHVVWPARYVPPVYADEFGHIQRYFSPLSNNISAPDPKLEASFPSWRGCQASISGLDLLDFASITLPGGVCSSGAFLVPHLGYTARIAGDPS